MSDRDSRAWVPTPDETLDAIGTTDDEHTTCRELAAFLFRALCDAVAVDLTGEAGRVERVAEAGAAGLLRPPGPGAGAAVRAVDAGHPLRSWTLRPGGPPVHGLSVELARQGTSYGILLVVRTGAAFTDREAAALHFAARVAAVHVRHARRLAATESVALDLQRALVSDPGRPHPNLLIAGRYLPVGPSALVGGDWFETVRLHYGRTLLVVGDVMGHGLDAAVDMNAYRSTLREVASTDLAPHRVLRQLDAVVSEDAGRRPATCLLVRVDPARGTAVYASAGHLPPAVFAADGTGRLLDALHAEDDVAVLAARIRSRSPHP